MSATAWVWLLALLHAAFLCLISGAHFDQYTCLGSPALPRLRNCALKVGVSFVVLLGAGVVRYVAARLMSLSSGLSRQTLASAPQGGAQRVGGARRDTRFWLLCGTCCLIVQTVALRDFERGVEEGALSARGFGACWYAAVLFASFVLVSVLAGLVLFTVSATLISGGRRYRHLRHHETPLQDVESDA